MRIRYLLALSLFLSTQIALAQPLGCNLVQTNTGNDFNFNGQGPLTQKNGSKYKVKSSAIDNDIQSNCKSQAWPRPLDDWLYGEENFLWHGNPNGYTYKEAKAAASSRNQESIRKFSCDDSNQQLSGYYAYSYVGTSKIQTLDFLCTLEAQRGKGYGLEMLNLAVQRGISHFQSKFTFRLIAHPSAIGFYNRLTLGCTINRQDEQEQHVYTTSVQPPTVGPAVSAKLACLDQDLTGETGHTIDWPEECVESADYSELLQLNTKIEEYYESGSALYASCAKSLGTISFQNAIDDLKNMLPDQ